MREIEAEKGLEMTDVQYLKWIYLGFENLISQILT